jgi:hypothetical protein
MMGMKFPTRKLYYLLHNLSFLNTSTQIHKSSTRLNDITIESRSMNYFTTKASNPLQQKAINRVTNLTMMCIGIVLSAILNMQCTSVTEPTDIIQSRLTVRTFLETNTGIFPVQGATVTLTEVQLNGTSQSVGSPSLSDANGVVVYQLQHPVVGRRFVVNGTYNSIVNDRPVSVNVCADTSVLLTFTNIVPPQISCSSLNSSDSLFYRDDNRNDTIRKDLSVSERCKTLFVNNGVKPVSVADQTGDISPFTRLQYLVDGQSVNLPITLNQGQSLSACFSVSTASIGTFNRKLSLKTDCEGNTGKYELNLKAIVAERVCNCPSTSFKNEVIITDENRTVVEVGKSESFESVIVRNTANCEIRLIPNGRKTNSADWINQSPTDTRVLQPNEEQRFNVTFQPRSAGVKIDTFMYRVILGNGVECSPLNVIVSGKGCILACPDLYLSTGFPLPQPEPFNNNNVPTITLSNTRNGRVNFSSSCSNGGVSTANRNILLKLSGNACSGNTLTINTEDNGALRDNAQFFSVSPRTITMSPGSDSVLVNIRFVSPSIPRFKAIYDARGRNPQTDSTFTISLVIQSQNPTCFKRITVNATPTNAPSISPVRNIRAYRQQTTLKPSPEYEVYTFEGDSLSARRRNDLTPFPGEANAPLIGDMYLDVSNNAPTAVPPLPPIMYIRNGGAFSYMARLRRGYPESNFDLVTPILTELDNDIITTTAPAYFNPLNPIWLNSTQSFNDVQPGDVYMFWDGGFDAQIGRFCRLSLMYVRQVNNGTENNTNKQSAIEFRALNGIR